jgi:hypothetical protein
MRSAWLIGSREWAVGQTITIDGDQQTIEAPLGGLYLYTSILDLSLLGQLRAALIAAGVDSPEVELLRNRRIRISAAATFSITWGDGVLVRELLGFVGASLAGASSYVAPIQSTLLWSPGKTETPKLAPLGIVGGYEFDIAAPRAWGGLQVARTHGPPMRVNEFEWQFVPSARYWVNDPPSAGEFADFYATTLVVGRRWLLYRNVVEDSSTTPATLGSPLGPYALDLQDKRSRKLHAERSRSYASVDAYFDVSLAAIQQPEYGQI